MSVSYADRILARAHARAIVSHRQGGAGALNHIAANLSFEETLYRGILTECAFANYLGLDMDDQVYDYGDGGKDFTIRLQNGGPICAVPVNVKSKSVHTSLEGLIRSGTHLRVTVRECRPNILYVFGVYLERADEAEVLRYAWGHTLIRCNFQDTFKNGDGRPAYILPYDTCYPLSDLQPYHVV